MNVEEKAEKWDKYASLGFLPAELLGRLGIFLDELRGYSAPDTPMMIKAESLYQEIIRIENPLKMEDKLEAIRTLNERFKEVPVTMRGEFWKELDKILEDKK